MKIKNGCEQVKAMMTKINGNYVREGMLFIVSRRANANIQNVAVEISGKCLEEGIVCNELLVDKSFDRNTDRDVITLLLEKLDGGNVDTLVVQRMADLTDDIDDLEELMNIIANKGINIFDLSIMQYRINNYEEGC